jgi:hypothetical protein
MVIKYNIGKNEYRNWIVVKQSSLLAMVIWE